MPNDVLTDLPPETGSSHADIADVGKTEIWVELTAGVQDFRYDIYVSIPNGGVFPPWKLIGQGSGNHAHRVGQANGLSSALMLVRVVPSGHTPLTVQPIRIRIEDGNGRTIEEFSVRAGSETGKIYSFQVGL